MTVPATSRSPEWSVHARSRDAVRSPAPGELAVRVGPEHAPLRVLGAPSAGARAVQAGVVSQRLGTRRRPAIDLWRLDAP
jgi:hypothetical protein